MICHRCGAADAPWPVLDDTGRHYYCGDCVDALNGQTCCDCARAYTTLDLCERCEEPLCEDCREEHMQEHEYAEATWPPVSDREWFEMKGGGRF